MTFVATHILQFVISVILFFNYSYRVNKIALSVCFFNLYISYTGKKFRFIISNFLVAILELSTLYLHDMFDSPNLIDICPFFCMDICLIQLIRLIEYSNKHERMILNVNGTEEPERNRIQRIYTQGGLLFVRNY